MGKGKRVLTLCMMLPLLLLSGCSEYIEIENRDILTSMFVSKQEDRIMIGGGIANVRNFSSNMEEPVSLIFAEGSSLNEARVRLMESADHKLFYGAARALVFENNYAENGISEFLFHFKNDSRSRLGIDMFTTSTDPREIVRYKAVNDFSGGFAAESIAKTLIKDGYMPRCSVSDALEALTEQKVGFILPNIEIQDEIMRITGYSIFDGDKKVGFIPTGEEAAVNYLLSDTARYSYYTEAEGSTFLCHVTMTDKQIDVEKSSDGQLKIGISLAFEGDIDELSSVKAVGADMRKSLSQTLSQTILDEVYQTTERAREMSCDFLGFYRTYQSKYRYDFDQEDWKSMIHQADITADVTVDIKSSGMIHSDYE